jgi:hypothetical protein
MVSSGNEDRTLPAEREAIGEGHVTEEQIGIIGIVDDQEPVTTALPA